MKKALFLASLALCFASSAALATEWYEGGTLQKETAAAWVTATPENKLATAGEYLAAANGVTEWSQIADMDDFRQKAEMMQACLDHVASKMDDLASKNVRDLFVACNDPSNVDSSTGQFR